MWARKQSICKIDLFILCLTPATSAEAEKRKRRNLHKIHMSYPVKLLNIYSFSPAFQRTSITLREDYEPSVFCNSKRNENWKTIVMLIHKGIVKQALWKSTLNSGTSPSLPQLSQEQY